MHTTSTNCHRSPGNTLKPTANTLSFLVPKLSIENLAQKFAVSPSYFSEYFKKMSGKTLSQYILKSKLHIVETKVLHTDQSIKEIAYDLNFTDSSHLSRSFKQVYGMTIKEFRDKQGQVCRI